MKLSDRIRRLLEGMPDGAAVSLPVETLRAWVEESGPGSFEPDLTVADVAGKMGRSPVTIRAWIRSGQLKAYRFQHREWRVTSDNLQDFMTGQQSRGIS